LPAPDEARVSFDEETAVLIDRKATLEVLASMAVGDG
jgi:hypothetical protein